MKKVPAVEKGLLTVFQKFIFVTFPQILIFFDFNLAASLVLMLHVFYPVAKDLFAVTSYQICFLEQNKKKTWFMDCFFFLNINKQWYL